VNGRRALRRDEILQASAEDQKKLVRDLRRRVRRLIEVNRQRTEFLSKLGHELRTPLGVMRYAVELLRVRGAGQNDVSDTIDQQLDELSRLVDRLLDPSNVARTQEVRKEASLAELIDIAVKSTHSLFGEKGQSLAVDLPAEQVFLETHAGKAIEVLIKLLQLASTNTEPNGRVGIRAECRDGQAILRIATVKIGDRGATVDWFAPGNALQGDDAGAEVEKTLLKQLVAEQRGSVDGGSQDHGRASEFVLRLPCIERAEPKSPSVDPALPPLRILAVDDNRDAADALAVMLRFFGHDVHVACDAAEALRIAANVRPDVALLDLGLPHVSGYELARRIRKQPWGAGMRLIAVTGWGSEIDRRRANKAGFDEHLLKPLDAGKLRSALANAVRLDERRA
jgi:CheY-like chemotaxis protein